MDETAATGVWRRRIATVLLIVFMVTIALSVPAIWVRNQMLDTDRFVRTVAPLGANADIQQAVATRVSSYITTAVAETPLVSEGDGALAAIIPMATTAAVDTVTQNFVTSPDFPVIWEDMARLAHQGFQALLDGGESELFSTESGQVSIDLSPVVTAVQTELTNRGINITLPQPDLTFVLFESSALAEAQDITKFAEELAIILPLVALVALIGYIVLSTNRWGAIVVASLGMAIMMGVLLILLSLARWFYARELDESVDKDAAMATFDILTYYLRMGLRILGLAAIVISLVVYLAIRRRLGHREDEEARRSLYERWPALAKFEHAVATNRVLAIVAWCMAVLAILLLWDWQDLGWALVLLVVGGAGVIIAFRAQPMSPELLALQQAASSPPAPAPASEMMTRSLQELGELKKQGLLSDEEFARAKSSVLGAA
jgi:hypothetical protein